MVQKQARKNAVLYCRYRYIVEQEVGENCKNVTKNTFYTVHTVMRNVLIIVSIKCSRIKVSHFYDGRHTFFTIVASESRNTLASITVHSVITFPAIHARVTVALTGVWN